LEELKKYTFSSVAREVKRENWVLLLYSFGRKLGFILQNDEVCLFFWSIPSFLLGLRTPFLSYFMTELLVLITVNVTNVTCRGCYHFRWSETSLGSL